MSCTHDDSLRSFVRDPTLYGYTRTRSPSEPDGFTPLTARQVIPHVQLQLQPAARGTHRAALPELLRMAHAHAPTSPERRADG